jgi:hypothetical protein
VQEKEKNKQQKIEINDSLLCHTPIRNKESIDKLILGKDYKLIKIIIFSLVYFILINKLKKIVIAF